MRSTPRRAAPGGDLGSYQKPVAVANTKSLTQHVSGMEQPAVSALMCFSIFAATIG
jgi:hypothetical protein